MGVDESSNSGNDCGKAAFHISRASAVDSAVGLESGQGWMSPFSPAGGDDIEMADKQEGGFFFAGPDMGGDVGTVCVPCVNFGLYARSCQLVDDDFGGGEFALFRGAFGPDQLFEQMGNHIAILSSNGKKQKKKKNFFRCRPGDERR